MFSMISVMYWMITLPFVDEKSNWDQRQVSPHPPSKPAGRDAKSAKGEKGLLLLVNRNPQPVCPPVC